MESATAQAPAAAGKAPRKGKLSDRARAERKTAYLLCAPAVIAMLIVTGYPILYAVYLSLQKYDLRFPSEKTFVGLSNYGEVLSSSTWWQDVFNTLVITIFSDRSFTFITKTPPVPVLIKRAVGIAKGSAEPNKNRVGKITLKQVEEIAKIKMPDLNCFTVEAAMNSVKGTARSMGVDVEAAV